MGKGKKKKRPRHVIDGLEEEDNLHGRSTTRFDASNAILGSSTSVVSREHIAAQSYKPGVGGTVHNDEWQTTRRTWAAISDYFEVYKDRCVWMPFYYDGQCADHLRSLGFSNVVHTEDDFFERVNDARFIKSVDLIWDNPPYTSQDTKERVLRAMVESGKPFALLLPISVLHAKFVRNIVPMDLTQCIIPHHTWVCKRGEAHLGFKYLCWFCCRTALERDILYVGDEPGE